MSSPTVWRWVRAGNLPALRVGKRTIRIRRDDLESALRSARPAKEMSLDDCTIHLGNADVDQLALIEQLREAQQRMLERRGGVPFPSSVELIREAREERSARL